MSQELKIELSDEEIRRIDDWRHGVVPVPDRASAAKYLIEMPLMTIVLSPLSLQNPAAELAVD